MNERRSFLRYACELEVKISGQDDDIYMAQACDISEEGISMLVPRPAVSSLSYTGLNFDIGDRVKIALVHTTDSSERQIVCSVSHTRRLSQEQYLVGIHFEDLRTDTKLFINGLLKNARCMTEENSVTD